MLLTIGKTYTWLIVSLKWGDLANTKCMLGGGVPGSSHFGEFSFFQKYHEIFSLRS